jgi:UDP-N-acetylmuramate--alanine ligase
VLYEPCWADVPGRLADLVRPGDVVVTMGAGDVTMLGPRLLAELAGRGPSTAGAGTAGCATGGAGPP